MQLEGTRAARRRRDSIRPDASRPAGPGEAACARAERGAAAIEFAIVAVLLLTLLYGLLTYGFVFGLQHNLTHAASEGARAGLKAPAGQETERAEARATDALSFKAAEDHAVVNAELLSGADCEPDEPSLECIRVTITYEYKEHPVVPPLFNVGIPETMTGTAVVQLD